MKILRPFEIAGDFGPWLKDYVFNTIVAGRDDEPKLRTTIRQLIGERD